MAINAVEFRAAMEMFEKVPALDALDCLCTIFNVPMAWVQFKDGSSGTVVDLYEEYEVYCGMYAKDLKLIYYGGPPGASYRRFRGSLMTLLADKFLMAYTCGHHAIVSKLLEYANEQKWYNNKTLVTV